MSASASGVADAARSHVGLAHVGLAHVIRTSSFFVRLALLVSVTAACATGNNATGKSRSSQAGAPKGEAPLIGAEIGRGAPAFSLRDVDGAPAALVAGKVNLVFFWATWSEPDKKAIPKLQEVFLRQRDRGLALLGLSVDDEPEGVAEFARTYGASFPVAWDAEHKIANLYRPPCSPTFFVVDRGGVVRFIHCGYHDGEADEIATEVESLLGASAR